MNAIGNHILVRNIIKGEQVSPGGIIAPETAVLPYKRGLVVSVGEGVDIANIVVKKEDTVVFGAYSGIALGDGRIILTGEDILLVE